MTCDTTFVIDDARLARVAARLAAVRARAEWFAPRLAPAVSAAAEADFWCLVIAICQQTRTARGVVDGEPYRGSDWLVARARRRVLDDPVSFTPAAVRAWSRDDLRAFFSDDGDPASSPLDRVDERRRLLTGLGDLLVTRYDGHFLALRRAAAGRVAGDLGIAARLAESEAYGDPARKKTWLLLLFLRRIGLLEVADPDSILLPVDYHLLRVLLRAGVVLIQDDLVRTLLVEGRPCPAELDVRLRTAVSHAGARLARAAGRDLFEIDNLLWMIGRNCCFYEHPPVCREAKPCSHREGCSLIASTDYACLDRCPLEGACRGSEEEAFASLRETSFDTHWY